MQLLWVKVCQQQIMSFTTKCDVKLKYFCNLAWEGGCRGWLSMELEKEKMINNSMFVHAIRIDIFIIVQICEMMMDFNDCREDELSLRITRSAGGGN